MCKKHCWPVCTIMNGSTSPYLFVMTNRHHIWRTQIHMKIKVFFWKNNDMWHRYNEIPPIYILRHSECLVMLAFHINVFSQLYIQTDVEPFLELFYLTLMCDQVFRSSEGLSVNVTEVHQGWDFGYCAGYLERLTLCTKIQKSWDLISGNCTQ